MSGNSPAFPEHYNPGHWELSKGLTKREYFAAMAMPQLLAFFAEDDPNEIAKCAFLIADAMIKESNNAAR